jgi:hypothetical protein
MVTLDECASRVRRSISRAKPYLDGEESLQADNMLYLAKDEASERGLSLAANFAQVMVLKYGVRL